MQIHLATTSDAEQIAGVLIDAFREFEPLYTPAGFAATALSAEEVARRLDEGPTWVAQESGVVVGTVSAIDRVADVYVRSMAVTPSARGHGVAGDLLATVEAFAIRHGKWRLTLTTTPFLFAAIHLYERAGFRRTTDAADLYGTPLMVMIKQLSAG